MNGHPKPPLLLLIRVHKKTVGIGILWLLVNTVLLWQNGIVTTGEPEKYLRNAQLLLSTGTLESANFRFYFIPIALLSLCIRLHLSFAWIVAGQLALSGFATLFFYRTATALFPGAKAAFIITSLLILNIPYQAYNCFLQTESIFQSITLLLVCRMARTTQPSPRRLATILITLLVLSATRPNGLLYWPIVGTFIGITITRNRPAWIKLSIAAIGFAFFIALLNLAMGSGGELDFILPFREQHIVCGVPTVFNRTNTTTSPEDNSIAGLFGYIFHHLPLFTRLALLKSRYFWGLYRDYFSPLHNVYLILYFYPATLAAIVSLNWWRRHQPLALFCLLTPILLTWAMVILTCDDWHNRLFLGISPFLPLLCLPLLAGNITASNTSSHTHY